MSSYAKRIVPHPPSPVIDWMKPFEGYRERRIPVLYFLDYIFKALAVLNDAYRHMFPTQPPHSPCQHEPHQQDRRHLNDMAGQGERMVFVGMLLRTTDRIFQLKEQSLDSSDRFYFAREVKSLKGECPEMAHGVAVLNFLTAGLCSNDPKILFRLLHLVQALKEAGKSCEHHHCDVNFFAFYKDRKSNCTLTLLNKLLDQCSVTRCDINCKFCQTIRCYKAKLEPHLDPSRWNGCADCESMLVDILVYAAMFYNTERRMMASLRLSLNCSIDLSQTTRECLLKKLELQVLAMAMVRHHRPPSHSCLQMSVGFEVLFISGYQHSKKEPMHKLLERFIKLKNRKLFYLQWKNQVKGRRPPPNCCEPQIKLHLKTVMAELAENYNDLLRFIKVHVVLEQDPCKQCRDVVSDILTQLKDYQIPSELVSMLPYDASDKQFLKRLTKDNGPVQLKDNLHPLEGRNVCMVHKRCKHVRCHKHCHYSKPGAVLAVEEAKLRSLYDHKQESFCWFSLYPLPTYWVHSL